MASIDPEYEGQLRAQALNRLGGAVQAVVAKENEDASAPAPG